MAKKKIWVQYNCGGHNQAGSGSRYLIEVEVDE